jgi:hypothetical protein
VTSGAPKWSYITLTRAVILRTMPSNANLEVTLRGQHVVLVPLSVAHVDALAEASGEARAAGDSEI